MSELKRDMFCLTKVDLNWAYVYYADDADKVIAELKADYKEACDRLQTANLIKDEQLAATRHQKRKRCLAMAYTEWLKQILLCSHPHGINFQRALQRQKKWLALADKFKN